MKTKRHDPRVTDLGRLNAQLKAQGERICPCCGKRLQLNAENFYPKLDSRRRTVTRWSSNCKVCTRFIVAERGRARYKKSAEYRKYKRAYRQAYFAVPGNREMHRARSLRWARNNKRQRMAARLGRSEL